jgi:hypothetical protein
MQKSPFLHKNQPKGRAGGLPDAVAGGSSRNGRVAGTFTPSKVGFLPQACPRKRHAMHAKTVLARL